MSPEELKMLKDVVEPTASVIRKRLLRGLRHLAEPKSFKSDAAAFYRKGLADAAKLVKALLNPRRFEVRTEGAPRNFTKLWERVQIKYGNSGGDGIARVAAHQEQCNREFAHYWYRQGRKDGRKRGNR